MHAIATEFVFRNGRVHYLYDARVPLPLLQQSTLQRVSNIEWVDGFFQVQWAPWFAQRYNLPGVELVDEQGVRFYRKCDAEAHERRKVLALESGGSINGL